MKRQYWKTISLLVLAAALTMVAGYAYVKLVIIQQQDGPGALLLGVAAVASAVFLVVAWSNLRGLKSNAKARHPSSSESSRS